MNPSVSQIQSLVARNSASSMNDIAQTEPLPAHPPLHFKKTLRKITQLIIDQLRLDSSRTFSSADIGLELELSSKTVQRALKKLQREGFLRLHKLRTGFVQYTYHANPRGGSLTTYDAAQSLLEAFPDALERPELDLPRHHPFTKAEAIGIADLHGYNKKEAEDMWEDYRSKSGGLETDDNWSRYVIETGATAIDVNPPF